MYSDESTPTLNGYSSGYIFTRLGEMLPFILYLVKISLALSINSSVLLLFLPRIRLASAISYSLSTNVQYILTILF